MKVYGFIWLFVFLLAISMPVPTLAGETVKLNNLVQITLPDKYHKSPPEFASSEDVLSFSGPINRSEIQSKLDRYDTTIPTEGFLDHLIENEFLWDKDDSVDANFYLENLKSLKIYTIEIVPDTQFVDDRSLRQIPVSQALEIEEFCESFGSGFRNRWGDGSFYHYDKTHHICTAVNVWGAVISVSVLRLDSYYIFVESIDWPLALLDEYANDLGIERRPSLDFKTASDKEKLDFFAGAINLNHAKFVLQNAEIIKD